jgi:hypothetical protein
MTLSADFRIRSLSVAVALAAAALLLPALPASAKDDPAKIKADREALKKEMKDKKLWYFHDLSYSVDPAKLKETRWEWKDPPPFKDLEEKKGGQFMADFCPTAGGAWAVRIAVIKMPHYQMTADNKRQPFERPFDAWGRSVLLSKIDEIAQGYFEDWIREATDVLKEKCIPTKKKNVGPAEYYSSAVGTDKELKVRVRKDWYHWGTTGAGIPCTWVAEVTFSEKFWDKEEFAQRAEDVIKNMKEITDKRAKQ